MKKGLVVLLIAVLALGAVFADVTSFTGKLTSTITWNLDEETLKLEQKPEVTAKFTFGLFNGATADGAAQGEGYPYAVIEGTLGIDFDELQFDFNNKFKRIYEAKDAFWEEYAGGVATVYLPYDPVDDDYSNEWFSSRKSEEIVWKWNQKLSDVITTAKIVGENWELDLLENFGVGNFASSAIADSYKFAPSKKVSTKVAFDMDNSTKDGDGVTFTYDGYKVAVNQFAFDFEDKDNNDFELSFQTKDFEYEGVSGTVGVNFKSEAGVNSANVSAKAGYTVSDVVLAAAADLAVAFDADSEFDVAFDANYKEDAVKFDFYYASTAVAENPYFSEDGLDKYNKALYKLSYDYTGAVPVVKVKFINDGDALNTNYEPYEALVVENLMSLQAVVDVAKLVDLGPVSALSAKVDGHNILNKDDDPYKLYAWNAELNGAVEEYGTTAKFGVKKFTVDTRTFYAEATTDFAKFAELPVNTLTLTVGSNDLDMDKNVQDDKDCLYVTVASDINDDLSVSVKGNYLAGKERTDKITVEATYKGIEKLTLGAKVAHEFAGNNKGTFVEATAKYEHDLFTADAKIQTKLYKDSNSDKFGLYAGATSDKIVHGATLSLAYSKLNDDGDIVDNDWCAHKFDKVVAKCVIAF